MKIAIIGTRGIPNHYGGFEQFAEYVSVGLVELGHEITVYNSHTHPCQEPEYKGVTLVHCKDPEDKFGTAGQFLYDLNCIRDTRKKNFDIILQLGYTSSSIWSRWFPKHAVLTTNMDGLEWKRSKYSKPVQAFLRYAEKLAVKHSDHLISDSIGIQDYLLEKYNKASEYIPYGANVFERESEQSVIDFGFKAYSYNMLIARLEPENNIETILSGVQMANNSVPFIVVGNHETAYGKYIKDKFVAVTQIKFVGGIYDQELLNNLRHFSNLYFHGHTVGGTNPSLLEAMASTALIVAHDNVFNKAILGNDALYFSNSEGISKLINVTFKSDFSLLLENNKTKINSTYSWKTIVHQYLSHFTKILNQ